MSKQTIYVRHKDEIIEKIIEGKNKLIETPDRDKDECLVTAYRKGFVAGCEWTLNVGENARTYNVDGTKQDPAHYEESQ